MASAGATTWPPDTERFFMELSTMITRAQQQRNATATQFDSSEFFVRRVEEYEITLSVLRASSYEPGFRDLGTSLDLLKKISTCSYERAGWLGCRDLGFSNRDLGKRAESRHINKKKIHLGNRASPVNRSCQPGRVSINYQMPGSQTFYTFKGIALT